MNESVVIDYEIEVEGERGYCEGCQKPFSGFYPKIYSAIYAINIGTA